MSSTNNYLLRNEQDESTSSNSTIRSFSEANQNSYFTASNEGPTLATVETVIDTGEKDKSVEGIKVKEERKGEQSVEEEDEDYVQVDIQVEDDKSYQSSYISNGDSIMSPSSWSSASSHRGDRGGRGRGSSSHHGSRGRGSSSHHDSRSNHVGQQGRSGSPSHHDSPSNHGGQQGRPTVPVITTQDQLNELTRIQANL